MAIALSMLVLFGFQYFFVENRPVNSVNGTNVTTAVQADSNTPAKAEPITTSKTSGASNTTSTASIFKSSVDIIETDYEPKEVVIDTDLYHAVISEHGASFKTFKLKKYKESLKKNSGNVELINVSFPTLPGVIALSGQGGEIDLKNAIFKSDSHEIILNDPGASAEVSFTLSLSDGSKIIKKFSIKNSTYWIDLDVKMEGATAATASVILYDKPFSETSQYIFSGPSYLANDHIEEVSLDDPGESHTYTGPVDWMSYGDNYFMTAVIPKESMYAWQLNFRKIDSHGFTESKLTTYSPIKDSNILKTGLFFGPKDLDSLQGLGHNLEEVVNFGWFDIIAKPVLYLLKFIYKYIGNYGIAIILVTILIKIIFWPLAQTSAKSMKMMQKLQPKMKKLKEKYGDDKEALNREMLQLYKTYKVNPMSGCMPMLIQIPVFFALYKVLLQSIELRHAPFMLWINDLSAPDRLMIPGVDIPYLGGIPVLTLLMGASMYLQQKLSPTTLDPAQAKMMQFLPVVFTFMFLGFPSGLVLYWFVNNILSIAQQYYVNKYTE